MVNIFRHLHISHSSVSTARIRKAERDAFISLAGDEGIVAFDRPDLRAALERFAEAPAFDGWHLLVDDDGEPSLISIMEPGSENPCFFLFWKAGTVVLARLMSSVDEVVEIGRFASLDDALLGIRLLHPESGQVEELTVETVPVSAPRKQ